MGLFDKFKRTFRQPSQTMEDVRYISFGNEYLRVADSTTSERTERLLGEAKRFEQAGDIDKAVLLNRDIVELDPNCSMGYYNLGTLLHNKGLYVEAIHALTRAIELEPEFPGSYFNMSYCYKAMQRYQEALHWMAMARERNPDDPEIYFGFGCIFMMMGDTKNEVAAYERTIELDPTHLLARNNLALTYRDSGMLQTAVLHFTAIARLSPNSEYGMVARQNLQVLGQLKP
jgi:tetratricopeptide (TPR) repeat protein